MLAFLQVSVLFIFELTKALLLRVFNLAALWFGSLHREFLLKRASERASEFPSAGFWLMKLTMTFHILFTIRKCAAR